MDTIGVNLQAVRRRIAAAAAACGRDAAEVGLVAVSKTFDAGRVAAACAHGQYVFGENYVQEALEKMAALQAGAGGHFASAVHPPSVIPHASIESRIASAEHEDHAATGDARCHSAGGASPQAGPLVRPLEWHFIGPIQSNKTRAIAEHFSWVHSVDRLRIAERLSAARPQGMPPLQVCIQVNIGGETSKGGVAAGSVLELARAVVALRRLSLRGLMCVPPATPEQARQRDYFAQLRRLKENLNAEGMGLDTLSMGMSADLEAAIMEGATLVRVGTAIFGERTRN